MKNISLGAGGLYSWKPSIVLSDYEPIAIAGYFATNSSSGGKGCSAITFYQCIINIPKTQAYVDIRNSYTASAKVDIAVEILYRKK